MVKRTAAEVPELRDPDRRPGPAVGWQWSFAAAPPVPRDAQGRPRGYWRRVTEAGLFHGFYEFIPYPRRAWLLRLLFWFGWVALAAFLVVV